MLTLLFGSRPEAIKMGAVAAELRALSVPFWTVATGQHTDLLRGTPAETDLANATSLGLPATGDPIRWAALAQHPIARAYDKLGTGVVAVVGDTASALAGARAAVESGRHVAHIEAGVRSGCLEEPWPEEGFRREITRLASWHYAPTTTAYANLLAEGVNVAFIRLTGNAVVSALARYGDAKPRAPESFAILTMHRREWLLNDDIGLFLHELAEACYNHPKLDVIWPVHPHVRQRLKARAWTRRPPNLWLEAPWPYAEMVSMLSRACGVATDSGGLVEEAATLGVPCAIMRRHNDRPEAVEAGVAVQFGPEDIAEAVRCLAQGQLPRRPTDVFGDVGSARRIAEHLAALADLD